MEDKQDKIYVLDPKVVEEIEKKYPYPGLKVKSDTPLVRTMPCSFKRTNQNTENYSAHESLVFGILPNTPFSVTN